MDLTAGSWGRSAQDHEIGGDVLDAGFSPNGSALTTKSGDGQVKFFIVNVHVHVEVPSGPSNVTTPVES